MKKETQFPKDGDSVFRTALGLARSLFPKVLSPLFLTLCVWVAAFAVVFVWQWSILLLFPLAFLPSFFALSLCINDINDGGEVSASRYFAYFLLAYSPDVRLSFRLLRSFFASLLLALGAVLLFGFVCLAVAKSVSPSFLESFNAYLSLLQEGDLQGASSLLLGEEGLLAFRFAETFAFEGVFSLAFVYFFLRNGIVPLILRSTASFEPSFRVAVFQRTLREKRNGFGKTFQKAMAPLYILLPIFFALGILSSFFFFEDIYANVSLAYCVALSFLGFGLLLLSPYYHEVLLTSATRYDLLFSDVSLKITEEALASIATVRNESFIQAEIAKKNMETLRKKQTSEKGKTQEDKDEKLK